MTRISFILPVYNEENNIFPLYERLDNLHNKIPEYEFEIIFVNDGSRDNSLAKLLEVQEKNSKEVRVISFSRNFGHQIAVTAGQDYATGDCVIIMDTDLQDPPEICIELIKKWQEEGLDVVYAQRSRYDSSFVKKYAAWAFYRLLKRITDVDIPVDTGDFRLLSRRVNDEMKKFKEKNRFLRGISSLVGFKQGAVQFVRENRHSGKPSYTFFKSFKLALDGITSFSLAPIRLMSVVGLIILSLSFLLALFFGVDHIFFSHPFSSYRMMFNIVVFLTGLQMSLNGLIGEYIGRTYIETLDRPLYTVAETYGFKN